MPIDRIAADRPFYPGKHRRHGMNLQTVSCPKGQILWISGDLPGSPHDTTAARIWQIPAALANAGLIAMADKGYQGLDPTRNYLITPYKGRDKPASEKDANRAHARLRGPGERTNAQLKTWQHPPQTPLLPPPHRHTRQSHPRPTRPRTSRNRMKKAH